MGLASVARQNSLGGKGIGLTSATNVEFVKSTGLYDEVIAYDALDQLDRRPSVSVDFAGNGALLAQIHSHLGDALKYSCLVGVTHVEERSGPAGSAEGLPGTKPTLFFAPNHAMALFRELGAEEARKRMTQAWGGFLQSVEGTVKIERLSGLKAALQIYREMIGGAVDPAKGIVIEP